MHEPTNSEDLLWQLVFKYISYNGYHQHAAAVQVFLYLHCCEVEFINC